MDPVKVLQRAYQDELLDALRAEGAAQGVPYPHVRALLLEVARRERAHAEAASRPVYSSFQPWGTNVPCSIAAVAAPSVAAAGRSWDVIGPSAKLQEARAIRPS